MFVAAIEKFSAGAVVRSEHDDRVFESAHGFKLIDDTANLAIHAVDHGGMNGHFGGLKTAFLVIQIGPANSSRDFPGADFLLQYVFGQAPVRDDLWFSGTELAIDDAHFFLAFITVVADRVPSGEIFVAI